MKSIKQLLLRIWYKPLGQCYRCENIEEMTFITNFLQRLGFEGKSVINYENSFRNWNFNTMPIYFVTDYAVGIFRYGYRHHLDGGNFKPSDYANITEVSSMVNKPRIWSKYKSAIGLFIKDKINYFLISLQTKKSVK